MLAGALAGVGGAVGLAATLALLLSIGPIWQYAFNSSIPVIRDTALEGTLQDVSRLPGFIWGWRWVFLGLVVVGALLARIDVAAQRSAVPWHDRVGAAALLAVVAAALIAAILIWADQFLFSGADRSESLPTLLQRRFSAGNMVLVAAIVSLALAGATWLYWSWWYRHVRRWMRLAPAPAVPRHTEASADTWFETRQAHERHRRVVLALLAACLPLAGAAMYGYEAVRTQVRSGELWVEAATPRAEVRLLIARPARSLVVENTFGSGTVSVALLSPGEGAPVAGPVELEFPEAGLGTDRAGLDVASLPPGDYLLGAEIRAGDGGRVGYALLQSHGALVALLSVLVGLSVGVAFGLALLLIGMLAQRGASA
jgi:hypothetical protein